MKRIFIPTATGSDWQRFLAKPVLHWKKGASAMTTAACWEAAGDTLPSEISALLDASGIEALAELQLLAAIPEWETPLPGGSRASHTDVLALCRNSAGLCVIGVEAKVDEDFGPTIGEKRRTESPGQAARLTYLQELLRVVSLEDQLRYQLLHRTAAALLTAEQFHASSAIMLVQSFGGRPELRADFDAFAQALGGTEVCGGLYAIERPSGPLLYLAWCEGNKKFLQVELPSAL